MEILLRAWDEKHKCMAVQETTDLETLQSFIFHYGDKPLMLCTNIPDLNGKLIFDGDIMEDPDGSKFRIYGVQGGFVIKAPYWKHDLKDLVASDDLITESLANAQTRSFLKISTVVGNIYEQSNFIN